MMRLIMFDFDVWQALRLFSSRHRWASVLATLVVCALLALGIGYLLVEVGPLVVGVGIAALFLGMWMLRGIEVAYWTVIGVICLLPFASFPFSIGFTPTLLDAALGALFVIWIFQLAVHPERLQMLTATPLGVWVLLFIVLAVGTFVVGLGHAPLTSYLLRHFAEILLSVALFFLVVNTVRDLACLQRLVRALLLAAFGAAALGVILYGVATYVSDDVVIRLLSALGRLGYPTGPGVLRYIRDDPELPMRATSTSVDPNVLGSLLNITLAIGVPQLFVRRPLFPRRYLVVMLGVMALALLLTISRGSWMGVGVALVVLATFRYRKLWGVLGGGVALLLLLPQTQEYVSHLIAGFQLSDLATQMRLGEYKDALILIRRYPWLGVGFAGSPDIDTYIGVANVYLLIAEQMGLIGLASFFIVVGKFLARFWSARTRASAPEEEELESLGWGLHAGIVGALTGGIFDHYFFNLDFHHSVTLFWLVVGLATAATELIRRQGTQDTRGTQGTR
ncbi:MAG TPA: hypothetical protein ENF52_03925 [Chloroflexi bacterium]|nr:hypothetical protein [Chloroflexota bacterium]